MAPVSTPKMAKNAQPIMFATRSGTIVCVSNVATKKIAPTRANILASVMLCRKISSRRLKMASQVTLLGSRPIWTRIFANLRLSVAASRMRSSMMDISPLEPVRPAYRNWLSRSAANLAGRQGQRQIGDLLRAAESAQNDSVHWRDVSAGWFDRANLGRRTQNHCVSDDIHRRYAALFDNIAEPARSGRERHHDRSCGRVVECEPTGGRSKYVLNLRVWAG